MPGFTPTFGIQYPCAGETIDPTVFQTFADDVEAALAAVDALNIAALQRPRAAVRDESTFTNVNVITSITFDTTEFSSGITATATGFTTVTSGIYEVTIECDTVGLLTSVTSIQQRILLNGNVIYQRKISPDPALSEGEPLNTSGLVISNAPGDAIAFQWGWNGSGGPMEIVSRATIRKISDL